VNAPVTGRVLEVLARPGDVVETGRHLLVLDSADLGSAKADYAKAVSDVDRASAALKLVRELLEAKAIAQKEVREAENDQRKAIAERERAAARLRTLGVPEQALPDVAARADASTRVMVPAPRSGVIVERNVTPGQVVAFAQSDTPISLFVIADLSTMWVVADIYEPDVPKVHVGQAVTVRLPCCPGEPYEGKVAYVSDSVDKESRTVKVRVVVPNRGRSLKSEMFVKVTIGMAATRVLTIPQSAVHRDEGRPFVFVEKGSGFDRRPVTLGADADGFVEVTAGITPEDRVAGDGSILLRQGTK
jgi:cobalt-zinc-cadmium efflux system membrane fusion protein